MKIDPAAQRYYENLARARGGTVTYAKPMEAVNEPTTERVARDGPRRSKKAPPNHAYFLAMCEANGIPKPTPEFLFAPPRRWRFDFCWQASMLYLEVDGGVWTQGHHSRGQGIIDDQEKQNAATCLGWVGLRCTPEGIEDGSIFSTIRKALDMLEAAP